MLSETVRGAKVHILHGEFLEGLGPQRAADAQQAFCRAYRVSGAPAEHVRSFVAAGTAALQGAAGPDLGVAASYFEMATCIDSTHEEAQAALHVVREAISIRDARARQAAAVLAQGEVTSSTVGE